MKRMRFMLGLFIAVLLVVALALPTAVLAEESAATTAVETSAEEATAEKETHLYVGDEAPAKSAPGKFPYKHEELGGVASDAYSVDLAAADLDGDGIVYIAAHAGLIMQIGVDPETGEPIYADETAWAEGDEPIGKGKNWATCFSVTVPVVEPPAE